MATIADLLIKLDMDSAQIRDKIDKVSGQFDAFGKKISGIGKMIGAAMAADVVKDAVGALAHFVAQGAESADKMGKLAQSVGVPVEQLSALSHAAALSDVGVDELGKSLGKLSKGMAETAAGTGAQSAAFQALGIKVTDSSGKLKSSDAVLKEIAGKFAGMEDGAGKTALAMELFGKSGASLIPLLNAGADGIAAMEAEAKKLGLVITEDAAKSAEEFNDNLTRLKSAGNGLALQVSKQLTPMLSNLTQELLSSKDGTNALSEAAKVLATTIKILVSGGVIVAGVFNAVGKALGGVAAGLVLAIQGNFKEAYKALSNTGTDMVDTVKSTYTRLEAVWSNSADKVEKAGDKIAKKTAAPLVKSVEESKKALDKLKAMAQDYEAQVASFGKGSEAKVAVRFEKGGDLYEELKKGGKAAEAYRDRILAAAAALDKLKAQKEVNDLMADYRQKISEVNEKTSELAKLEARFADDPKMQEYLKALGEGSEDAKEKLRALAGQLDKATSTKAIQDEIAGLRQGMISAADGGSKLAEVNSRIANDPKVIEWMKQAGDGAEELAAQWRETAAAADKVAAQKSLNDELANMKMNLADLTSSGTELEKVNNRIANDPGMQRQFAALGNEAEAYKARLRGLAEETDKVNAVKNLASTLSGVFEEQLMNGFDKGLEGMVASFGQAVKKMVVQALAADLSKTLLGGLGGNAGGVASFLGFGGGKASGGDVRPGNYYRVGEYGPETFVAGGRAVRVGKHGPENFIPAVAGVILPNKAGRLAEVVNTVTSLGLGFGGARAEGGDVRPGNFYRVGERGPETFVPNVAGYVLPPADREGGGGTQKHDHFHQFDEKYMNMTFRDAMESFLAREAATR